MSPNPDAPQTPPDPASTAPGRRRRPLWPWLVLLAVGVLVTIVIAGRRIPDIEE